MHVFEAKFHGEAFTEAEPCFRFVRVVELLPRKLELPVPHEAGVEPEVEGAALVVSGHVAGRRLEEHPGVARQHRAVGGLHPQHVRGGVVRGLAVDLNTSVWIRIETVSLVPPGTDLLSEVRGVDSVAAALVHHHPEVRAVAPAAVHQPSHLQQHRHVIIVGEFLQ